MPGRGGAACGKLFAAFAQSILDESFTKGDYWQWLIVFEWFDGSSISTSGSPATGPAVTHYITRAPRRNKTDNNEDERNSEKANVTINDCDDKLGSNEETTDDHDTVEA